MRTLTACVFGSLVLGSLIAGACLSYSNPIGIARAGDGAGGSGQGKNEKRSAESSPFMVGEWKFIPDGKDKDRAKVDTEFSFINPTKLTERLEYAFFEIDGTFCGCDRDVLPPNSTVIYTVLGESQTPSGVPNEQIPFDFSCKGKSGALKTIVFTNEGQVISVDGTEVVGFQLRGFNGVKELGGQGSEDFIIAPTMTESDQKNIAITDTTLAEIQAIHDLCVTTQGPL